VAGEPERRLVHVPADACDDAGARGRKRGVIDAETGALQQRPKILGARLLGTRRIDRIERKKLSSERDDVGMRIHEDPRFSAMLAIRR
jgi:hypothetical protein